MGSDSLGFGRERRLKKNWEFQKVRNEGERVARGTLIGNWRVLEPGAVSRLGVVTSAKIGGAVQRNRARRLLREVFRLHQHELKHPVELVLVARNSIVGKSFQEVERDYLRFLEQVRLKK